MLVHVVVRGLAPVVALFVVNATPTILRFLPPTSVHVDWLRACSCKAELDCGVGISAGGTAKCVVEHKASDCHVVAILAGSCYNACAERPC